MKPKTVLHRRLRSHKAALALTALCAAMASTTSYAIDFGPDDMFSITGFAESTIGWNDSYCRDCQVASSGASKQVRSSDAIIPGKTFGSVTTAFWQVQPTFGVHYNLGGGFKLNSTLSQRWRDGSVDGTQTEIRYGGKVDVPNYWYDKNIAISHENYGRLAIGAMTTHAWNVADYPYATNIGLSSSWASTGAGYGMLANAVRYSAPILDVGGGDLGLEVTYDYGNNDFSRLKPEFWELYSQYNSGGFEMIFAVQNAKNGGASSWGHAPFSGVTPFGVDDNALQYDGAGNQVLLKGQEQSMALLMGSYWLPKSALEMLGGLPAVQVMAGLRYNDWSGADSRYSPTSNWVSGFNADFNTTEYKGYSVNSVDAMLGARIPVGKWTFSTGMVYLGTAQTDNPSERGQSNSALINTLGARYDVTKDLQFESTFGLVHYRNKGLSPMSMPGNSSGTDVDSRVTQDGRWLTVGFVYVLK